MPTLTEKRNAAGDRYAAAVVELRSAFVDLSALDRLCQAPSFGVPPNVIELRHPSFARTSAALSSDGIMGSDRGLFSGLTSNRCADANGRVVRAWAARPISNQAWTRQLGEARDHRGGARQDAVASDTPTPY